MAEPGASGFLPEGFDPDPALVEQLSSRPGYQRVVTGGKECLLVLHEVPQPGVPERQAVYLWQRADGKWLAGGGRSAAQVLNALLDRFGDAIDEEEAELEAAESAKDVFAVLRHASPLARSTRNLAKVLYGAVERGPDDRMLVHARDRAKELERAAELLLSDATTMLDFRRSEAAEEHAEAADALAKTAFRLNLLAGFFLPLVALGGLLGMNVDLPDWLDPGFWPVVMLGLVLGGVVVSIVGRKGRE